MREFGARFKSTVRDKLAFWRGQNKNLAEARAAAYALVLSDLVAAAQEHDVPLQDIGIEDFEIPTS